MILESNIRKLARSYYWQRLYQLSQDHGNINLFENISNFSGVQVLFLYWLQIYSTLNLELAQLEWIYLDEKVLEDDLRTDAFLYWRLKKREKQMQDYKKEEKKNKSNSQVKKGKSYSIYQGSAKDNK